MGFTDIISAIFGGGVTGLLGAVISKIADYKNKQLDITASREKFVHEVAMREADAKIMAQEWAARTKVAEIEVDGRTQVADAQAFAASFNEPQRYSDASKISHTQSWLLVILDFIRGVVRPGLTLYLCGITTAIYIQARHLLGSGIPEEHAYDLLKLIINTVLYLTTTCILWWFGSRNKDKPPKL